MGFSELLTICDYGPEKTKKMAVSTNKQPIRFKQIVDDLIDVVSIENKTLGMLNMVQDTLKITLTELCEELFGSENFHSIDLQQPKYWPLIESLL
ncbi:hypothetical protein [Colwellia sp. C1TZA3]|uniref:hypothetical protein n=1 Tax=Colwellia sp. C1TZA3 TaxID=2508879 RepID=UPI0011BA2477|nr:hypothetical protein [Colwellia sp. C1TZA3]TWX63393.1 hypothetical protein ESZ39_16940 [Colwellia sp. C1TZA3]